MNTCFEEMRKASHTFLQHMFFYTEPSRKDHSRQPLTSWHTIRQLDFHPLGFQQLPYTEGFEAKFRGLLISEFAPFQASCSLPLVLQVLVRSGGRWRLQGCVGGNTQQLHGTDACKLAASSLQMDVAIDCSKGSVELSGANKY